MRAREFPDTVDIIEQCLRSESDKVASRLLAEAAPEVVWLHGNLKRDDCEVSVFSKPARVSEHRGKPGCWVVQHTQYTPDDYGSVNELSQDLKEGDLAREVAEEAKLPGGLPAGWIKLK